MIKEKDVFDVRKGWDDINAPNPVVWFDPQNELTADLISQYLSNSFQEPNLAVTITQDDFQYKTGFMKSETCPCLVIRSAERGDGLSRFVLAVKKNYENSSTIAVCAWHGQSESDRLNEQIKKSDNKYNKGLDKQKRKMDQQDRYADFIGMVGTLVVGSITNKLRNAKINKLVEQHKQARVGEHEYYIQIIAAVNNALNVISSNYEVCR